MRTSEGTAERIVADVLRTTPCFLAGRFISSPGRESTGNSSSTAYGRSLRKMAAQSLRIQRNESGCFDQPAWGTWSATTYCWPNGAPLCRPTAISCGVAWRVRTPLSLSFG